MSEGAGGGAAGDRGVLALRFDVDSVTCIEHGIPRLRELADRLGVRFTFFVNMGHSFNWSHNARHALRKRSPRPAPASAATGAAGESRAALPTTRKLGWAGVLKTVVLNPALGERYRATFDALHAEGHELGLHGGTDHVVWQRSLGELSDAELDDLFRPAFERFCARYGRPAGFASPGFRFNESVLRLLEAEGFRYASDMPGEEPFATPKAGGGVYPFHQVPVNVLGAHSVPLIEQGLARGQSETAIVDRLVEEISERRFALAYGHPYVEGVRADLLGHALERVRDRYDVVTVKEYLERWRAIHG